MQVKRVTYDPQKSVVKVEYFTDHTKWTAEKTCIPTPNFIGALDSFVDDLILLLELNDPDHWKYRVNQVDIKSIEDGIVEICGTKTLARKRVCVLKTPPTIMGIDSDYDNGEALAKKVKTLHERALALIEVRQEELKF